MVVHRLGKAKTNERFNRDRGNTHILPDYNFFKINLNSIDIDILVGQNKNILTSLFLSALSLNQTAS